LTVQCDLNPRAMGKCRLPNLNFFFILDNFAIGIISGWARARQDRATEDAVNLAKSREISIFSFIKNVTADTDKTEITLMITIMPTRKDPASLPSACKRLPEFRTELILSIQCFILISTNACQPTRNSRLNSPRWFEVLRLGGPAMATLTQEASSGLPLSYSNPNSVTLPNNAREDLCLPYS